MAIVSSFLYTLCGFNVIFEYDKELFCKPVCNSVSSQNIYHSDKTQAMRPLLKFILKSLEPNNIKCIYASYKSLLKRYIFIFINLFSSGVEHRPRLRHGVGCPGSVGCETDGSEHRRTDSRPVLLLPSCLRQHPRLLTPAAQSA